MFLLEFIFSILTKISCSYTELEEKEKPVTLQKNLLRTVAPSKFYWFEYQTIIYLLHFEVNPEFHRNAFVLLLSVPKAKAGTWFESRDDKSLADALNYFRNTSAFLSLFSNKPDRNYYSASVTVNHKKMEVRLVLEKHRMFVESESEVKEHTEYTYLLNFVKIGTKFWDCFYREKDHFQKLFVQIYYIIYPKTIGGSNSVSLFRVGNVTEISFFAFQTELVKEKTFLKSLERVYEMKLKSKCRENRTDLITFDIIHLSVIFRLYINLEENRLEMNTESLILLKQTTKPELQKLSQTGHNTYFLEDENRGKLAIELPIYFIKNKLEISKLFILFRVVIEKLDKTSETTICSKLFKFQKKQNFYSFDVAKYYLVYVEYGVENNNLVFRVPKISDVFGKMRILKPKLICQSLEIVNKHFISIFLNGMIIYDPSSRGSSIEFEPTK